MPPAVAPDSPPAPPAVSPPAPPAPEPPASEPPCSAPLRADAARNRRQILLAAAAAFADKGSDVPMEEIARAAGVGVGTLYRRFPDRGALVLAVVEESLRGMLTRIDEAEAGHERAWDALVASLGGGELRLTIRPDSPLPRDIVLRLRDDPDLRDLRRRLVEALERLVRAAQAEGSMRADVGIGDVTHLFAMVGRSRAGLGDMGERVAERTLAVVLDGLRAEAATPMPGEPLTRDDLARWSGKI